MSSDPHASKSYAPTFGWRLRQLMQMNFLHGMRADRIAWLILFLATGFFVCVASVA